MLNKISLLCGIMLVLLLAACTKKTDTTNISTTHCVVCSTRDSATGNYIFNNDNMCGTDDAINLHKVDLYYSHPSSCAHIVAQNPMYGGSVDEQTDVCGSASDISAAQSAMQHRHSGDDINIYYYTKAPIVQCVNQ